MVRDEFCYLVLLDMVQHWMIEIFYMIVAMWHVDEIEEPPKSSNIVGDPGVEIDTKSLKAEFHIWLSLERN